jgi:hypothetical protein
MEEVVNALMSAADEEAWERVGLFEPVPSHFPTDFHTIDGLISSKLTPLVGSFS